MFVFYVIAILPLIVGAVLWHFHGEVIVREFLGSAAAAFVLAAVLHGCAVHSQLGDLETWSGQITGALYEPAFTERYLEHHSENITNSKGEVVGTRHWTTVEHDYHPDRWSCFTNIDSSHSISSEFYRFICKSFQNQDTVYKGSDRCTHFGGTISSGDKNVYTSRNTTGYIFPVSEHRYFENRLKNSRNIFFSEPTPDEIAQALPYPKNDNWQQSDRLVGTARDTINPLEFDRMNARLGPAKRVNFILVGAVGSDSGYAQLLRTVWKGGKKNDLILVYGTDWAYCFGWTEKDILKRTLESIATEHGVSTETLPLFEDEIAQQYELVDWSKFDYIAVTPTQTQVTWYVVLLFLTQGGLWFWFLNNEHRKDDYDTTNLQDMWRKRLRRS